MVINCTCALFSFGGLDADGAVELVEAAGDFLADTGEAIGDFFEDAGNAKRRS